jgi:formylglycine-generating enzyme required for sulfatase activity
MGFVCAACDGLSIETAKRTAADTGTVEETGGSESDAGDDTALDTSAEDTAVDTATDTATDTAVDTAPDSAADTAADTTVSAANRCGGDAPLTYRGVAAGPGDSCGLCGDGQLFCSGTNDLTCAGASQPNDCGGCGLLTGDVGTSCGLCDDGVWACGGGSADCVGDRPPNGCGGCTALALEPGTECPLVGGDAGVAVCAGRELSRCASVGTNGCGGTAALTLPAGITGVEPRPGVVYEAGCRRGVLLCDGATLVAVDLEGGNDCGGCEPLLGEPGDSCDSCGGVWVCDVEGGLRCNGGGRNACGGCELLAPEPGSACNEGGTPGAVICIGAEETGCVPPGATNDCGGLGTLSGEALGSACGACSDGVVACDGTDPLRRRTACTGASAQNACGGCGILDATVGSACGTCGTGDYACDGTSLVCSNDGGGAAANVCGGCSTLAANPGDPCGRCGSWACDAAVPGRLACNEPAGGCATVAVCGNGAVETGESCDDGNRVTEACAYAELSCTVCNASCQSVAGATAYCGDGVLDAAEVCDEGASNGAGSCSVACTCATGYHLEGGVCTSDTRACVVPNGTGSETWTGSGYGVCVATSCASGYSDVGGVCVGILGAACTLNAECASGFCAQEPDGSANDRCAPPGMVWIPAGTFTMGSPIGELGRASDETEHLVTLARAFFLDRTEVTQQRWKSISGDVNPSYFQNSTCTLSNCTSSENANDSGPVEQVSWYAAIAFANALSLSEGLPVCYALSGCADVNNGWQDGQHSGCTAASFAGIGCSGYRLPTESEWEYAARAGRTTATFIGNLVGRVNDCSTLGSDQPNLDGIAWWCKNSARRAHGVGMKGANPWGLLDILGNVWEWTWDRYGGYPDAASDPTGAATGSFRVLRGGGWNDSADQARAAFRFDSSPTPDFRYDSYIGFRLARTAP